MWSCWLIWTWLQVIAVDKKFFDELTERQGSDFFTPQDWSFYSRFKCSCSSLMPPTLLLGQLLKWRLLQKRTFFICFILYIWTIWRFDNRTHNQHLINLCMCLMANLCCIRRYYLIKLYDKWGTASHFFESKLWKTVVENI